MEFVASDITSGVIISNYQVFCEWSSYRIQVEFSRWYCNSVITFSLLGKRWQLIKSVIISLLWDRFFVHNVLGNYLSWMGILACESRFIRTFYYWLSLLRFNVFLIIQNVFSSMFTSIFYLTIFVTNPACSIMMKWCLYERSQISWLNRYHTD